MSESTARDIIQLLTQAREIIEARDREEEKKYRLFGPRSPRSRRSHQGSTRNPNSGTNT